MRALISLLVALPLCATTVTLNDANGNPQTYALQPAPRVFFDGPNGTITAALKTKAVSTNPWWNAVVACLDPSANYGSLCQDFQQHYGNWMGNQSYSVSGGKLANITVASNVATVSLKGVTNVFLPGATPKVSGSATAALNGSYVISTLTGPSSFTFPTSGVPDGTYTDATVSIPNYEIPMSNYQYQHVGVGALYAYITGDTSARAAAIWALDHVEDITATFACDETQGACGYRQYDTTDGYQYAEQAIGAYQLLYSYLSPAEKSAFADKMLNDNDTAHGGLNPLGSGCTADRTIQEITSTISVNGTNTVVGTGTTFKSYIHSGDTIWLNDPVPTNTLQDYTYAPMTVVYVIDDTHLTVSDYPVIGGTSTVTGRNFAWSPKWQPGHCGLIWLQKHSSVEWWGNAADYPPNGGTLKLAANNLQNQEWWGDILLGLGLADDDPRAVALLQNTYNAWYTNALPMEKSWFTGLTGSGPGYGASRMYGTTSQVVYALTKSVIGLPSLTNGNWLIRELPYVNFFHLDSPNFEVGGDSYGNDVVPGWGDAPGISENNGFGNIFTWSYIKALYPTSQETANVNYWDTQVYHNWTNNPTCGTGSNVPCGMLTGQGSYVFPMYVTWDPSWSTAAPTIPTQYLFRDTDAAQCASQPTWTITQPNTIGLCDSRSGFGAAVSRLSLTDGGAGTVTIWNAMGLAGLDFHETYGKPGGLAIYRSRALLADDQPILGGTQEHASDISINGDSNNPGNFFVSIPRWAGADPSGDSASRFAYAMVDFTGFYKTGVNRAYRHFLHFKQAGEQDYIVTYDDISLSSPQPIRSYWHYYKDDKSSIVLNPAGKTVASICNTGNCSLNASYFAPGGATPVLTYTDNPDGSYPGGNGYTYRVTSCPTSNGTSCDDTKTTFEQLVVFQPNGNRTNTLSASLLAVDSKWTGVIINDARPRVAVFARNGQLNSSLSFSANFTGTAQILVAGLAPGTYTVSGGGASPSSVTVNQGDTTLYFQAGPGTYTISSSASSPPPTIASSCDLNNDGLVNILDVQLSSAQALATLSCTSADLDQDGVCNVVDVQREVSAALGGTCKIGP